MKHLKLHEFIILYVFKISIELRKEILLNIA